MKIREVKKLFVIILLSTIISTSPAAEQSLWNAAKDGDITAAEKAIAGGANVNAQNPSGGTALIYACLQGDLPMIKFLLEKNADPTIKSKKDLTPILALAMSFSKKEGGVEQMFRKKESDNLVRAAQLLIDAGAKVNERGGIYGETPLMRAVRKSNDAMARTLLVYGHADVNIPESEGDKEFKNAELTPLLMAVKNRDYLMTGLLLANGANVNLADASGGTALMYAIENIDTTIVALLLDYKANVNVQNSILEDTPLTIAVKIAGEKMDNVLERKAAIWIINQLLKNGADANMESDEGTPVQIAERAGDDDVVKLINDFIEKGQKEVGEETSEAPEIL
ncbi:MAG: ankyrin repeat domain-containing protein [Candidatus Babeliales bacterium]